MKNMAEHGRRCLLAFTFIFSLIDLAVTTVTFGHGTDYRLQFLVDVYYYRFPSSMIELWVFGLTRTCILIGALLGFGWNRTAAVERLKCVKSLVFVTLELMWLYTMTKLLAYTEKENDLKKPWFWSLFSWTHVGLIGTYILWYMMSKIKVLPRQEESNSVNDDEETLIENTDDNKTKEKDSEDEEKKEKTSSMKTAGRLLKYSFPDWHIILTGVIFMTLSSTAEIFIPFYTGKVIDGIAIEKSKAVFIRAIIIMAILSIGSSIAAGIRGGCFKTAMARLQVRINNLLFSTLMKQEVAFYDATRTGEITSRLTSDTTTMTEALSLNVNIFLRSVIQALGTCIFMVRLSWRLSIITLMGLPLMIGVSELYGEYYKNLQKKVQDSLAKVNEVAEEACSSMRTVRSFANESAETQRYAEKLQVTYKLKLKEAVAYAGYMWSSDFISLALIVATLYYGGHLVIDDELSGGNLVSFILYQLQLGYCLETIAWVYSGVMQAVGASEKVFELIDRKPEINHDEGKYKPDALVGNIEFRNVTFTYPSRKDQPALKDVSFSVRPGEVVALVGPSGGGKSTIVNLLEHFYETEKGQVLLDGVPIQDYDHKYLHQKISLVGQEPVLYARSLCENIGYGLEDLTLDDAVEAAKQANADGFIQEMKEKYDTQAGEKGMQLSGGQKQRIAIARALIRNPVVLILDEATSALDSESEHMVQEAIYNNLGGRTVIIVAHRLSTVERADRIIVINKGQVVEQGTNSELLQVGGMYANLVKRQILSFDSTQPSKSSQSNGKVSRSPAISVGSFKSIESEDSTDRPGSLKVHARLSSSPSVGSV